MAEEPTKDPQAQPEPESRAFPEPGFARIVETFGVGAMLSTGLISNPMENDAKPDLNMAKYHIALLEILENRTKGNLSSEEAEMLEEWLHQTRMAYVQATKLAAQGKNE